MNALVFWLVLILLFILGCDLARRIVRGRVAAVEPSVPHPDTTGILAALQSRLAPMLTITGHRVAGDGFEFVGILRGRPEEMFGKIREAFAGDPVTPLLLKGEGNAVRLALVPGEKVAPSAGERPNWGMHGLLFVTTLATTTWAGALHAGVNLLEHPGLFTVGLPYSLGFLLILGSHELGHYFTAKAHGIRVTPPYFIPVPFALGTFGAFIKIKSLTPDRRALFDVAVAGPLAGLVFAIPALLIGLRYSQVIPGGGTPPLPGDAAVNVGSSVLLACLAKISLGASVFAADRLLLHPLAFAGWLGLIVTALNLLPIGQLDGGHISHALFGSHHARGISMVALAGLFFLALFVWPGLMLWAFIVFFIAGTRDAPAQNDVSPVGLPRKILGYLTFLILLLIIVPVPHALYEAIGIHSPYL